METPIVDFVQKYVASNPSRMHMPGHKGRGLLGCEPLDITEIPGADSLYGAQSIIAESEGNAARLFGFGGTMYSTEGSSQCLKAMLFLTRLHMGRTGNDSRVILAARNAHTAFLSACALLDLEPEWLYPIDNPDGLCACPLTAEQVGGVLWKMPKKPFAVYITSPDYLGNMQDVGAIAKVCDEHGIPLLVDNAHGAYLSFLSPSRHPVRLGAFMSCDSAHKTLPVLTGGAYLQFSHLAKPLQRQARQALQLFGSTSPSYLILQSLDLCNRYLSEGYPQKLSMLAETLAGLKMRLLGLGFEVGESDPLRLVLRPRTLGYTGEALSSYLHQRGIVCEYADSRQVVLMLTPENSPEDYERLERALSQLPQLAPLDFSPTIEIRGNRRLSPRAAMLAQSEIVPTADAVGRICAMPTVACPPAVPIIVSGEVLTKATVDLMLEYGYNSISVVVDVPSDD